MTTRLDTANLERGDVISTAPLAFRANGCYAVPFRYGVAFYEVFVCHAG